MLYIKSDNGSQVKAELSRFHKCDEAEHPPFDELANPAPNGGGAYVKLFGQGLTTLSSVLRQQFYQPFIEQPSHGDLLMQK
jgi:hypothetical protein